MTLLAATKGLSSPKRSIAENILLAQELVSDYHKSKDPSRCVLNIDLMRSTIQSAGSLFCIVCFVLEPLGSMLLG